MFSTTKDGWNMGLYDPSRESLARCCVGRGCALSRRAHGPLPAGPAATGAAGGDADLAAPELSTLWYRPPPPGAVLPVVGKRTADVVVPERSDGSVGPVRTLAGIGRLGSGRARRRRRLIGPPGAAAGGRGDRRQQGRANHALTPGRRHRIDRQPIMLDEIAMEWKDFSAYLLLGTTMALVLTVVSRTVGAEPTAVASRWR